MQSSKYSLLKVVVKKTENQGTPIVGYTMKNPLGVVVYHPRGEAWELVKEHGSSNCEAKTRTHEGETIKFLAPTDGIKVSERIIDQESLPYK